MANQARETAGGAGRARGADAPAGGAAGVLGGVAGGVCADVSGGWLKYRAGQSWYNWDPLSDPLFGDLDELPRDLHAAAYGGVLLQCGRTAVALSALGRGCVSTVCGGGDGAAVRFPIPILLYLIVAGAWLTALVGWAIRGLMRAGMVPATAVLLPLTLVAISFPVERLVHEGNIELVMWVFTALGVWAWWRGHDDAAAVLWGLAAAMKLFPMVLLILLLPRGSGARLRWVWARSWGRRCCRCGGLGRASGWHGGDRSRTSLDTRRAGVRVDAARAGGEPLGDGIGEDGCAGGALPAGQDDLAVLCVRGAGNGGRLLRQAVGRCRRRTSCCGERVHVMFPPISYYHTLTHLYAPLAVLAWVAIRANRRG